MTFLTSCDIQLDSKPPRIPLSDHVSRETRYRMVEQAHPETHRELLNSAQAGAAASYSHLDHVAGGGLRDTSSTSVLAPTVSPEPRG